MVFLKVIWSIAWKDMRVWLRHPLLLIGSLLVPMTYFLVVFLNAQAVGQNPVAVVNLDRGQVGAQLVKAIINADVFRVQVASSPEEAAALYHSLDVVAIITIPPDFSAEVAAHQRAPLLVLANNFNLDLAGDIRRAVPYAITDYYQGLGAASPINVTIAEADLRPQDIPLFQYSILPLIILVVTVSGIITAGLSATNEWEQRTITVLQLAPIGGLALIVGKALSGWVTTFTLSSLLLVFGAALNLTRPTDWFWASTLLVIALGSLVSAGVGIAIGAFFRRKQPVSYAATLAAVWLFALSGGVAVIFFEPDELQAIAAFDPLTYAIHALQQAVFYQSFDQFGRDVAVLLGTALVALALGVLALRREIATH